MTRARPPLAPLAAIANFGAHVERGLAVLGRTLRATPRMSSAAFADQLGHLAIGALPLTALATALAGAVTAMQSAVQLTRLGAPHLVADLTALGFARELGPLLAALLLAAKAGAGIAAEVGLLGWEGQIRALHALGLDADRELTAPRLWAVTTGGLLLTAGAIACGWVGALAVCVLHLGLSPEHFWYRVAWAVEPQDLASGLAKGALFGFAIGIVSLTFALRDKAGPAQVGADTMRAVVAASAAVLLCDPIATGLLRALWEGP